MRKLSTRQKISLLLLLVWLFLGALLLFLVYSTDEQDIATQQLITILGRIYALSIPWFTTAMAIIRRKQIIFTTVVCGLTFLLQLFIIYTF